MKNSVRFYEEEGGKKENREKVHSKESKEISEREEVD